MWNGIKWLSIPVIFIGAVMTLYSLVKIGHAAQPPASKPPIVVNIPGATVTSVERVGPPAGEPPAIAMFIGSSLTFVAGLIAFGYASLKLRARDRRY